MGGTGGTVGGEWCLSDPFIAVSTGFTWASLKIIVYMSRTNKKKLLCLPSFCNGLERDGKNVLGVEIWL